MQGSKSKYQSWAAKQRGNPVLLFVSAGCFTLSLYIFHSKIYKPWARKKTLIEAEEIAQMLYEQEKKMR